MVTKASYHLEELIITFEPFYSQGELDLSINSTYKIISIRFDPESRYSYRRVINLL